jgi:solute:Na+ symporter, SSS family
MVRQLGIIDILIIAVYLLAMVAMGIYFSSRNRTIDLFTRAAGKIPQWAVGLSMYATFLSSNTFLGVPGKAFGSNWNYFVFSLSMPIAAWIATRYFIPFYRRSGEISAYTHFEKRFGGWARQYAVICFLLTQLARMGSIFFGVALTMQVLTGLSTPLIIVSTGFIIIIYTLLGGIQAVIWTEVAQAFIKTAGAILILIIIWNNIPGGFTSIFETARSADKLSLGSLKPDFTISSFWVVLLYGLCINLNNFGMDQNYVQRYHVTGSTREAAGSVWLCVKLYVPASLLFFIIGTSLYGWYQIHPDLIEAIRIRVVEAGLKSPASPRQISQLAAALQPKDYGDKILPDFMARMLPTGLIGLLVAAILSAAMSSISSGINASATVFTVDIYQRFRKRPLSSAGAFRTVMAATLVVGLLSIFAGLALIGVTSILDAWWQLSGIFAAGMMGLFLLSLVSRHTGNSEALLATFVGILTIAWMTFSPFIPARYSFLRSQFNANMIIVIGTVSIFLAGILFTGIRAKRMEKNV